MARSRTLAAAALWIAVGIAYPLGSANAGSRGEALFKVCTACHGTDARGNETLGAPSIAGLAQWYVETQLHKFKDGIRGTHPKDFTGMRMRPMALTLATAGDVTAVAEYVASLEARRPESTLEGGDPTRGARLFVPCAACHNADASGNPQLKGPPLVHASDWYLLAQLRKFRAGIRGADPRDTFGALMRPMSLTLPDEQALKDVIAHISTLAR